jgi:hypothetical protein
MHVRAGQIRSHGQDARATTDTAKFAQCRGFLPGFAALQKLPSLCPTEKSVKTSVFPRFSINPAKSNCRGISSAKQGSE